MPITKSVIEQQCEDIRFELMGIDGLTVEERAPFDNSIAAIKDCLDNIESEDSNLRGDKSDLEDQVKGLKEEIDGLEDDILELKNELKELEQEPLHEETQFGDIQYSVAEGNMHHEQIMESLAKALEHGRLLHLFAYLEAYKPDTDKSEPAKSPNDLRVALNAIKRRAYRDGMESEGELCDYLDTIYTTAQEALEEIN